MESNRDDHPFPERGGMRREIGAWPRDGTHHHSMELNGGNDHPLPERAGMRRGIGAGAWSRDGAYHRMSSNRNDDHPLRERGGMRRGIGAWPRDSAEDQ